MAKKRPFILLEPIYNLILSEKIGSEFKIGEVVFASSKKIPRIRKRLGFSKTFGEMENKNTYFFSKSILKEAKTFAILKFVDIDNSNVGIYKAKITKAIWIFASSQFHPMIRGKVNRFGFPEHSGKFSHEILVHDVFESDSKRSWKMLSPIQPLRFGGGWIVRSKYHFFFNAIKIINGKVKVDKSWKNIIEKVMILCGKSIFTTDLYLAFLFNMISLETILTKRYDKFPITIIDRLNGLFDWYYKDDKYDWNQVIKKLYELRCKMVHDGDTKDIKTEHLVYSDIILHNLLGAISANTQSIKSQSDIIALSEISKAKSILKQTKIKQSKIWFDASYVTHKQIDEIKKNMSWD